MCLPGVRQESKPLNPQSQSLFLVCGSCGNYGSYSWQQPPESAPLTWLLTPSWRPENNWPFPLTAPAPVVRVPCLTLETSGAERVEWGGGWRGGGWGLAQSSPCPRSLRLRLRGRLGRVRVTESVSVRTGVSTIRDSETVTARVETRV